VESLHFIFTILLQQHRSKAPIKQFHFTSPTTDLFNNGQQNNTKNSTMDLKDRPSLHIKI